MVLQLAIKQECYIFDLVDAQPTDRSEIIQDLKSILESEEIEKVIHDARQDSAACKYQLGIALRNVFDTQVGRTCVKLLHHARLQIGFIG